MGKSNVRFLHVLLGVLIFNMGNQFCEKICSIVNPEQEMWAFLKWIQKLYVSKDIAWSTVKWHYLKLFSWSVWAQNLGLIISRRHGRRTVKDGHMQKKHLTNGWATKRTEVHKFCIIRATCVSAFGEIRAFVARARFEIKYWTNFINKWLPWLHLPSWI